MFQLIREVGFNKIIRAVISEMYRKFCREIACGSYAQDWEDKAIEKLINKNRGFYVDIGAYQPKRLSNTYLFYKKGWRGIVVEPNPEVISKFKLERPNDKLLTVGIGTKQCKLTYYKYSIPALNTFSDDQKKINENNGYVVRDRVQIKVISVDELLSKYVKQNTIDLLSLDVEGFDEDILRLWDWKYRPKVICVETNGDSRQISKILAKQNYTKKFENKINSIYVSSIL